MRKSETAAYPVPEQPHRNSKKKQYSNEHLTQLQLETSFLVSPT